MSKSVWFVLGAFVLLTLAGCKSDRSKADSLVKERIALLEQMASTFEGVTDKKSLEQAMPQYNTIREKMSEVDKQLNELPAEARNNATALNAIQLDQATERLAKAKQRTSKF